MATGTYAPDRLNIIKAAFAQCEKALQFTLAMREPEDVASIRDQLARYVFQAAESGESDPSIIVALALRQLPPMQAVFIAVPSRSLHRP